MPTKTTDVLHGLNPAQREAASHTDGPLLIVAGAGAGKTKTLTHRIAHLIASGVPAHQILAITFTNKAAAELRDRIGNMMTATQSSAPTASTFHALGTRILREFSDVIKINRYFTIIDRADQEKLVREILKELGFDATQWTPRKVLGYISNRRGGKAGLLSQLEPVADRYHALKAERQVLDFDDLIYKTAELLDTNQAVRQTLQQRWTHIHVDEYQDTNTIQYQIVRALAGDQHNICAVGDTDQTIYTWRGAEIENLMRFERDFPGTTTVLLEENYRCSKTIIAVANDCIKKNQTRIDKTLFTNNPDGDQLQVLLGVDENDEARQIAATIARVQAKNPSESVAILYRANFQSQALEKAFISSGLTYDLLGTKFYDRKEVKDMLAYLRYALNPNNLGDLYRIASVPKRGIGPKTTQAIAEEAVDRLGPVARKKAAEFVDFLTAVQDQVQTKPPHEVVEYILEHSGWAAALEAERATNPDQVTDRLENLNELIAVARQYEHLEPPIGTQKMLEEAALMAEQDTLNEHAKNTARMMTIHASKGLEFDHVFITGLEDGLFPSDRSDSARDREEERRLFYVALTRAKKTAALSYATMRHRFGSVTFNSPSEFITEIDPQYLDQSAAGFANMGSGSRPGLLSDIEF